MDPDALSAGPGVQQAPCTRCAWRERCLPSGLPPAAVEELERLIGVRRIVPPGEALFDAGDRFHALHAVLRGSFKSCVVTEDGREQVTGFQLAGELLGLDGIAPGRHDVRAVALEPSTVCSFPFAGLEPLAHRWPPLQRALHRLMSREIVRDQGTLLMLGTLRADERLAAFLLGLLRRMQRLGEPEPELTLPMRREEIASYLGLTLETVSRAFGRLQRDGLLEVHLRQVTVRDILRLQRLGEGLARA